MTELFRQKDIFKGLDTAAESIKLKNANDVTLLGIKTENKLYGTYTRNEQGEKRRRFK